MSGSMSNIEAVARDTCSKQMLRVGLSGAELATYVDRYWRCVAAEIESGQIDETEDRVIAFDLENGLTAYRDWCQRHP
jgi:hypothetical protein